VRALRDVIFNINCDNILECFFGLNSSDISIYINLLKSEGLKIEEIGKLTKKRYNSIYKSLQKLMMAGIVIREKRVIEEGGYYYIYKAVKPKFLAQNMRDMLEKWYNMVLKAINEFENRYDR